MIISTNISREKGYEENDWYINLQYTIVYLGCLLTLMEGIRSITLLLINLAALDFNQIMKQEHYDKD